jgi:hypothetical protein
MNVFVITCNDSVEHVVKGTENFASDKLAEIKEAYYQRTKGNWTMFSSSATNAGDADRAAFNSRCFWAARPTPMTEQS